MIQFFWECEHSAKETLPWCWNWSHRHLVQIMLILNRTSCLRRIQKIIPGWLLFSNDVHWSILDPMCQMATSESKLQWSPWVGTDDTGHQSTPIHSSHVVRCIPWSLKSRLQRWLPIWDDPNCWCLDYLDCWWYFWDVLNLFEPPLADLQSTVTAMRPWNLDILAGSWWMHPSHHPPVHALYLGINHESSMNPAWINSLNPKKAGWTQLSHVLLPYHLGSPLGCWVSEGLTGAILSYSEPKGSGSQPWRGRKSEKNGAVAMGMIYLQYTLNIDIYIYIYGNDI